MSKKNQRHKNEEFKNQNQNGIASVKNQLNESFQSGVVDDQLDNNRGIHTFNNQKN